MRQILPVLFGISFFCAAQQPLPQPLTTEQQALFNAAKRDFGEHHPELALEKLKQLHASLPDNATITNGTAETAIVVGEDAYALSLLIPWTASHPEDLFSLEWLARAYAESGDVPKRDQTLAALLKLHETTANEQFKHVDRFLVEHIKLTTGSLDIYYAIVPFSQYHIHMLGRQVDANNVLVRQITLESSDIDQVIFAKQHPDLVAGGMRRFSMDTYSAGKADASGTVTQTQGLIDFMDGRPSYDETKSRMLKVANGEASPKATRSGIPVTKPN